MNDILNLPQTHTISLIKGSHILIEKLYEGQYAYLLQHDDKRIVFVMPYYNRTLIGTTEVPYSGSLSEIETEPDEISYLFNLIKYYFGKSLQPNDILWKYSGVRPYYLKQIKIQLSSPVTTLFIITPHLGQRLRFTEVN